MFWASKPFDVIFERAHCQEGLEVGFEPPMHEPLTLIAFVFN
jgi:hypothetical protein